MHPGQPTRISPEGHAGQPFCSRFPGLGQNAPQGKNGGLSTLEGVRQSCCSTCVEMHEHQAGTYSVSLGLLGAA